jgi:general stress protein YciG
MAPESTPKRAGGAMTVAEAGRMGGRLVREKYGPEFYKGIGKKGGSSTAERYGPEFFGKIGRKGGKAVTAKYGPQHFEKIGRKGGQKVADLIERAKSLDEIKRRGGEEPAA